MSLLWELRYKKMIKLEIVILLQREKNLYLITVNKLTEFYKNIGEKNLVFISGLKCKRKFQISILF